MELAQSTDFFGAFVASGILSVVLAYIARVTRFTAALNFWSAGYAFNALRLLIYSIAGIAPPNRALFLLVEWCQVLQALALLFGALCFVGRPLSLRRHVLPMGAGALVLVIAATLAWEGGPFRVLPFYGVAGLALAVAGIEIFRCKERGKGVGFTFTAFTLIVWSLHKLNFVLLPDGFSELAHVRFMLSVGLYTAAALGFSIMALSLFHHRLVQTAMENEARFRKMFEDAPVGYQSLDEEGRIVAVNQRWLEMLGYEPEQVIGRHFGEFLSPSSRTKFSGLFVQIRETGVAGDVEFELVRQDGKKIIGAFEGRINLSGESDAARTHCVIEDVTAKRRREALVTRLGRIVDATSDEIYLFDAETLKFVHANTGAIANTGYSLDELHDMTPLDIKPDFTAEGFDAIVAPLRSGDREQAVFETRHRRKDGTTYDVEVRLRRMADETPPVFLAIIQDISARKEAEKARMLSEARLQAILDHAPAGIVVKDREGRYLVANRAYLRRRGLRAEEMIGRRVFDIAGRAEAEETQAQDDEVIATGEARSYLSVRTTATGGEGAFAIVRFPLFDEKGEITSIGVISIDVTRERQAETALRENEEKLRLVLESTGEGIYATDLEGRCTLCNPAAARILGYDDPAELLVRDIHGLIHHSRADGSAYPLEACQIHRTVTGGVPLHGDNETFWRRDGRPIPVEFHSNPVFRDGAIVGAVVSFADISERKKAEAWLLRLSQSVEQGPFGVIITDGENRIEYANPSFLNETGYTMEELRGQPASIQNADGLDSPADREIVEAIKGGRQWRGEVRRRRKNGEVYWASLLISPIRDKEGRTVAHVGITEDISERRRMAEHLRQAQKMEAVGQLTGGVAHDFNNILSVILTSAECLADDVGGQEDLVKLVAAIVRAVHRGAGLTDRLLAFSRRQDLSPEVTDLGMVVYDMADMLRRSLGETIAVTVQSQGDTPPVVVDRGQFENALLNLAVNARDAMPHGGSLTVGVARGNPPGSGREEGGGLDRDFVCVTVTDTGSGMPPEVADRVFEPFFTTKGKGQGTGLGLSMVYGFVKQSGGDIAVDSIEGEGTSFRLYFPVADASVVGPAAEESNGHAGALPSLNVVLAEDDAGVRTATKTILENAGLRVTDAGNGIDALDILKRSSGVDLLLTDVIMPGGLSGRDLAEAARAMDPDLRVLFTSGYADGRLSTGDIVPGVTAFVPKPYTKESLLRAIHALWFGGASDRSAK